MRDDTRIVTYRGFFCKPTVNEALSSSECLSSDGGGENRTLVLSKLLSCDYMLSASVMS